MSNMAKKIKKFKVGMDSETYAISLVEAPAIESEFVALAKEEEKQVFLESNERHMVYVDNKGIELTYKEYELLRLLMRNAGIVLSREMIMERVWDTEFEGESRTVDMHIKTLRQKLGDAGSRIRTVRNVGYVIE